MRFLIVNFLFIVGHSNVVMAMEKVYTSIAVGKPFSTVLAVPSSPPKQPIIQGPPKKHPKSLIVRNCVLATAQAVIAVYCLHFIPLIIKDANQLVKVTRRIERYLDDGEKIFVQQDFGQRKKKGYSESINPLIAISFISTATLASAICIMMDTVKMYKENKVQAKVKR